MSISLKKILDCKLLIRFGGEYVPFDVLRFTATYAVGDIPQAEVDVPLGTEFDSGLISNSYLLLSNILVDKPCFLVIAMLDQSEGYVPIISHGQAIVFAGYISNIAYVRTGNNIALRVALRHWLSDMDFASTLSASSHPSNPKNLIYDPRLQFGGLGSFLSYSLAGIVEAIVNPLYAAENLWGNAIFPFLRSLVRADRINNQLFGTGNDTLNLAVLRALSSWRFSVLSLDTSVIGPLTVSRMVSSLVGLLDQQVQPQFLDSLANITLWKALLYYSQQYLFSIIPFPLYYRVEPVVLGLMDFYKIVTSDEILNMTIRILRPSVPLRAVGIYTGMTPLLGSALDNPTEASQNIIGGWYISNLGYGLVKVVETPPFFSGPFDPAIFTRAAVGGVTDKTPLLRSAAVRDLGVLSLQRQTLLQYYPALDKLAHYVYITEQLLGRTAVMVCPFRMDIAPGSTIRIDLISSSGIPVENFSLYGLVHSVSYTLDNGVPTSVYNLIGIRSFAEFMDPDFSVSSHPFYSNYFIGSPHF